MRRYGIDFSNGKNGGMPVFCAALSVFAALLCVFFLLEEDASLLPGVIACAAAAFVLAICSVMLHLKKRRSKRKHRN